MTSDNSKHILIIKAGSKLPSLAPVEGDFENWIMRAMTRKEHEFKVLQPRANTLYPAIDQLKAVIITGSAAMVTDHSDWIESCANWLYKVSQTSTPVLGICFGHQLLAYALGGTVDDNPAGVEVGTVHMRIMAEAQGDVLFSGMPAISVQASHKQAVLNLPEGALCLSQTDKDSNHAFRYQQSVWGVQFHPEFNAEITRHYICYYHEKSLLDDEAAALLQACHETPVAASLLQKFSRLIGG